MGKRKESSSDDEGVIDNTPIKKHKKHKHKRHKKRKTAEDGTEYEDTEQAKAAAFRLKIKFQKEAAEKNATNVQEKSKDKSSPTKPVEKQGSSPKASKKKRVKGKESGTSSEEERWLDAIESGKLEEVDDELKKIKPKDPKLMTARQRAMFERKTDKECGPESEQLLALPSGYKEKVMTAEAIEKAALKSKKRKQLANEKREKDKKKTMERLLKKQESKSGKATIKHRTERQQGPCETYYNGTLGVALAMPPGADFPIKPQKAPAVPVMKYCGVSGCKNIKKYSCSKTKVPLCSLECYKRNLELWMS
ncbi:INO80 complex subunit B [Schistocerca serialis cubense]|uniref:INO80 complex subunit B n=1 Tax=Schistocerca serialis cubense TaxID=2023355 RepID=UPI00214E7F4D|nr:INO80 complex subunit B [Schistocerca serialis cubense]